MFTIKESRIFWGRYEYITIYNVYYNNEFIYATRDNPEVLVKKCNELLSKINS